MPFPRFPRSAPALLVALAWAAALPAAQAQALAFDIPAQALDATLAQIARQGSVQLVLPAALAQGRQAPAVRGQLAVAEAFGRALAGSGLEAQREGSTVVVRPVARSGGALGEVRVTAQAERSGTTEGSGSYTTRAMAMAMATGLPLSIRETPQSVSVITRQRIEDQGLVSLADVVQAAPGITVTKWGGERYRFSSRGFQINNLLVDGLPIQYEEAALSTGALSMYDRVEVMRGVAGLVEGAGTPGGSINLVRKRPTREFQGSFTASVGSWNDASGSLDVGGPLNAAGTLRGRTVLSYQDKGSYIDGNRNQRTLLYGLLEADVAPSTTVSLGASYSNEDNPGADWNGLGTWPDGSFLPLSRSTRMSPSWSYWDKRSTTLLADVQHRFANGWKAKLAATAIDSKMNMLGTYLNSPSIDAAGQPLFTLGGGAYDYDRTQRSIDGQLSGSYAAWGRTHDLAFGASHRRSRFDDVGGGATVNGSFTLASFNPLSWDPASVPLPTIGEFGLWQRKADMRQSSLYGTTRLDLGGATKLVLGGRLDWYESNQVQYDGDYPYGATHQKVRRKFTPYAGLVHDLDSTYAVYGSWTRVFNPQSYNTAAGGTLPPEAGSNLEVGIKGEYLDGRLNASAALFQIDLEHLPDALPASSCSAGLTSCYQSAGKVRSRGVEFELTGEIARGWQVSASYTYASAKRVAAASDYDPIGSYSVGSRYATNMPRHLVKLATQVQLPGALQRWRLGGSVYVQNEIYSPWGVYQGGYAVVGLQAGYAVTAQLDLLLNVNNLFDRIYYSGVGAQNGPNFFGAPRNAMLTARYRF